MLSFAKHSELFDLYTSLAIVVTHKNLLALSFGVVTASKVKQRCAVLCSGKEALHPHTPNVAMGKTCRAVHAYSVCNRALTDHCTHSCNRCVAKVQGKACRCAYSHGAKSFWTCDDLLSRGAVSFARLYVDAH